jgi:glycine cleavage system aminomethyltransferase T
VRGTVVWQRLATQRREFGLQPYHVTAVQTLRLEKDYRLYGNDVQSAGSGWCSTTKGRPRVATATTTLFLDPQDMRLRAEEAGCCRHAMT